MNKGNFTFFLLISVMSLLSFSCRIIPNSSSNVIEWYSEGCPPLEKDVHTLSPKTCELVVLSSKRDFADRIESMDFEIKRLS